MSSRRSASSLSGDGRAAALGAWISRAALFVLLVVRKLRQDHILEHASSLAFATLFSIVPLLAIFSFIGNRVVEDFEAQVFGLLRGLLPYSDATLLETLREFLRQAESLSGLGLLALVATALVAFANVEATLNRIWRVTERRPLRTRLLSFTLVVFWGPILLGVSFSGLPWLGAGEGPLSLLLAALTFAALMGLYWLVPNTRVRAAAAAAAAASTTILLLLLHQGFRYYADLATGLSIVYGGFALVLLFMVSVNLAWTLVLLGGVVAYVIQHFAVLGRGLHEGFPLEGRWAGLAVLVTLTERLRRGRPVADRDDLASRLGIAPGELRRALSIPVSQGWVREREGGFLLAREPGLLSVAEIFEAYDRRCREIFRSLGPDAGANLDALVRRLADADRDALRKVTLSDLVTEESREGG